MADVLNLKVKELLNVERGQFYESLKYKINIQQTKQTK